MPYTITALDMHFLVKELQVLISAKVDKIYQPNKQEFLIVFHIPRTGKKILRINLPNYMYLTEFKGDVPSQPSEFCKMLRKYLTNARLREFSQLGFERIVELVFEKKDGKQKLYIELFSIGNLVLTNEEGTIRSAVVTKKWRDRTIRGNIKYEYPRREHDCTSIGLAEFQELVKKSDKESIVKTLALDLGLGGRYSEELCLRASIDKSKKNLTELQIKALFKEIDKLRKSEIQAMSAGDVISPVQLTQFQDVNLFNTFSEALDNVITKTVQEEQKKQSESAHSKELKRLQKVLKEQEETIKKLKKSAKENQKKGELIFEEYTTVNEVLIELNKAKEKLSWKEIKAKLKGHKVIKEIHEKNKEVIVEL